jgi:DNA repair protein RadC
MPSRAKSSGAAALSDAELLAVILRTGMAGKTVLQMAQELLELPGDHQQAVWPGCWPPTTRL